MKYYSDETKRVSIDKLYTEKEIINFTKKDDKGYYVTVPTYIRRNSKYRISDKKYNSLVNKYKTHD